MFISILPLYARCIMKLLNLIIILFNTTYLIKIVLKFDAYQYHKLDPIVKFANHNNSIV